MADQSVKFDIGANVTGMEAIASLINKTDALGKSQKDLATAFEKMSGAAKKASDVQKAALQIDAARQEVSARAAQAFFAEAHAIDRVSKSARDSASVFEEMLRQQDQVAAAKQEVSARAAQAFFAETHAIDKVSKSARDSASVFEEMFRQQDQVAAAQREAGATADALRAKLDPMVPLQRQFNAAMDQADNLLSMGAINQREYAQAVELARQNLQEQTAALHASGAAQNGVIINGVRYNNMTDAQAKALRNHRQGVQMLGMQFIDLATSVSTGASPIQAFNQQLGQIGYSMSMMEGRLGKVGAFLAGPWGAAITIATMALGFLIEKFIGTDESADNAAKKINDLGQQFDFASMTGEELTRVNELLASANKQVAATAIQAANATAAKAASDANAAQQAINLARAELSKRRATLAAMKQPTAFAGGGVAGAALTAGQFAVNRQNDAIQKQIDAVTGLEKAYEGFQFRSRQFAAESYSLSAALDGSAKAAEAHNVKINKLRNDYAAGNISIQEFTRAIDAETAAYNRQKDAMKKSGGKKGGGSASALSKIEAAAKLEQDIANKLTQHKIKAELDWQSTWDDLQQKHDIKMMDRSSALQEQLQVQAEMNRTLFIEPVNAGLKELEQSYANIGNSVANAFKGMLTGASSWKDGMKGIINSVIDELWRLYVVQQIVGLVGNVLGGLTGVKINSADTFSAIDMAANIAGKRANGGHVSGNRPYLVGENGPELMVPGGSGTIIPNRNLGMGGTGGSGMTINVDARGANDPAAVRAQVQQGILEAAPAIIAAAEARTVQGLRRPRLGGAIK